MKPVIGPMTQDFAYLTHEGEVILLDELVREVHEALAERGVEVDPWPLKQVLQATRAVTELLAAGLQQRSGPEELFGLVGAQLRTQRLIMNADFIRVVLEEYLRQLRQLDIVQIKYF